MWFASIFAAPFEKGAASPSADSVVDTEPQIPQKTAAGHRLWLRDTPRLLRGGGDSKRGTAATLVRGEGHRSQARNQGPGSPDAAPASPEGPSAARRRLPPSRARSVAGVRGRLRPPGTWDLGRGLPGPSGALADALHGRHPGGSQHGCLPGSGPWSVSHPVTQSPCTAGHQHVPGARARAQCRQNVTHPGAHAANVPSATKKVALRVNYFPQ